MYEPITHINAGDVFEGYQQYFKVLDIYKDEATILVDAGDAHRVERGPVTSMIERLNAALDPDDNHDEYWEHEHPEVRPVAMWPDDCDYDGRVYEELDDGRVYDIETGEVYDNEEDGFICDNCFHYADASQMHTCPSCNEYVCDKCWNHDYGVCQDCIDEEEESHRQSFNKG